MPNGQIPIRHPEINQAKFPHHYNMLNPIIHPRPTNKSQKLTEFPQPRSDAPKPGSQAETPAYLDRWPRRGHDQTSQIARSRSPDQRTNLTTPAAGTIKQIPGPSLPTSFPKKNC